MGSFIGHAIPGTFFFLFGSWWIIAVLYRYHKSRTKSSVQPFRSSPSFSTVRSKCGAVDIEGILGVSAALIGIFVELIAASFLQGKPIHIGNMQHATMYFFFGLAALLNLLSPVLKRHMEEFEKVRYLILAFAMFSEGILFQFHLFDRSGLDVTIHTLLLYAIYLSGCVTLGEMMYPGSALLALGRGFFTVLQGTWFWQTGYVLYNPLPGGKPWDEKDHHQQMLLACFFTWHVGVVLLSIVMTSLVIARLLRRNLRTDVILQEVSSRHSEQHASLLDNVDDE